MHKQCAMITRRGFIVGTAAGASMCSLRAFAAGAKPNLRVGILSDTHINRERVVTVRTALEFFRDRKVDAVMIAGDLSTRGQIQELRQLADVWLEVFPGDKLPDGSPVERLFITGNHDVDGHCNKLLTAKKPIEKILKDSFYFRREKLWQELFRCEYAPVVKREVKGYVFVLRNWYSRLDDKRMKNAGLKGSAVTPEKNPLPEWFAEHGGELPKDRPFFFCQHETPANTCSWDGKGIFDDGTAYRVLEKHPNAIAFSGHSHYSLLNGSTIWQGAFTSIGCSASCGYAFTPHGRQNGHVGSTDVRMDPPLTMPPIDFRSCQQGMLMEVYDECIVLEKRDLKNGVKLGDDWIIPIGKGVDKPYLVESRKSKAKPPQFGDDAEVTVRYLPEGFNRIGDKSPQVEVVFPPINGVANKGERAFDFLIKAAWHDKEGMPRRLEHKVYSPNALMAPQFDDKSVTCRFQASTFADLGGGDVTFTVTPLSGWGVEGKSISAKWNGTLEDLDLYLLIGQSNMAGRGILTDDTPLNLERIYKLDAACGWVRVEEPIHFDKKVAGAGLSATFAQMVAAKNPKRKIGLIPCAVGGTRIDRWVEGGDLWSNAVARTKIALKSGKLKGILFHQGESDAYTLESIKMWGEKFESMVKSLRREFGEVPFIAGELGRYLEYYKNKRGRSLAWPEFNSQLNSFEGKINAFRVVSSEGLTANKDNLHFNTQSLREFGKRYAAALFELQGEK